MPNVIDSVEERRACGFRTPGGLYVVGAGEGAPCGKLPGLLTRCELCGAGVKPTRGFQWINPVQIFAPVTCWYDPRTADPITPDPLYSERSKACSSCPLYLVDLRVGKKAGLLWAGERVYSTPDDFNREADSLGVSRRVSSIPKGLKVGDLCFIAHRKAIPAMQGAPPIYPGIIRAFRITSLDYIVKGDESDDVLDRHEKRGLRLVRVKRLSYPGELAGA